MRRLIWILIILLILLHHDFWYWSDDTLVFGFIPIGLFYHICISLAAVGVWLLATLIAWPDDEFGGDDHRGRDDQKKGNA